MVGSTRQDDPGEMLDAFKKTPRRSTGQRPSPSKSRVSRLTSPQLQAIQLHSTFLSMEQILPASLLQILLLMAGIEPNPGPVWYCAVCLQELHRNAISVRCNACNKWCHMRRCTDLQSCTDWSPAFVGQCCLQAPPTTQNPPNHSNVRGSTTPLKFLQYNCNGITSKIDEILKFMHDNGIKVAAIQETKLTEKSQFPSMKSGHTIVRKDRGVGGGGLAFIIEESVLYKTTPLPNPSNNDQTIEQQCITIFSGTSEINIINIYIPPTGSCPSGYKASISHLLDLQNSILVGDLNAHHPLWDTRIAQDQRGEDLLDEIDTSNYGIINLDTPTRIVGDTQSSPDLTIVCTPLLPYVSWNTDTKLSSDHLPITLTLERTVVSVESEKRTYINFMKANWEGFTSLTEKYFEKTVLPTSAIKGELTFRSILKKGRQVHIPAGRIPQVRPFFPTSASKLADKRDTLRTTNPNDPRISEMNKEISKLVYLHKKTKWLEHLSEATFNKGPKNLWKTTKGLLNKQTAPKNNAIHFDKPYTDAKKCAQMYNKQFTVHPGKRAKEGRRTKRMFNNYSSLNKNNPEFPELTSNDLCVAIKSIKPSKAMGPDEISPVMIKHLGPHAIHFLTKLLNLSLQTLIIPNVWKTARIIPIPKPGKNLDEGKSFRPISLLSPVAKLLETLILPAITDNIDLADHQHGFRKQHSTTTALHHLHHQISTGLNQNPPCKRTILVALDMRSAFDTVSLDILLSDILASNIPWQIKRWLNTYVSGRQTYVEFRNKKSTCRRMKQGVPQGGGPLPHPLQPVS